MQSPDNSLTSSTQNKNLCSQLDNGLPNSKIYYPNGTTSLPQTNNRVCSNLENKYYSLPYRNPNCKATENGIKKAYERIKERFPQTKLLQQWKTVQEYSIKYNFNPLFVIALWLQESAAGGAINTQQLGCLYRRNKDDTFTFLPPSSTICDQMECLFGRKSVVPDNFGLWACQYEHGTKAWRNNTCDKPLTFTKGVDFWYNFIGENLSSDCMVRYYEGSNC
jgi:hypothetical protein